MTVYRTIGLEGCLMLLVKIWSIMVAEVKVVLVGGVVKGKELKLSKRLIEFVSFYEQFFVEILILRSPIMYKRELLDY